MLGGCEARLGRLRSQACLAACPGLAGAGGTSAGAAAAGCSHLCIKQLAARSPHDVQRLVLEKQGQVGAHEPPPLLKNARCIQLDAGN